MNKTIKRIIAIAVPVAVAAAAVITVFAYLQNTVEQPNKFNIGEGEVSVSEVFSEPETMANSNMFDKVVTVKNEGTSDQFVRVYLDFSDSRVRDKSKIVYTKNGTQAKSWDAFLNDLPTGWAYVPESEALLGGYFYYTDILAPDAVTPPLIEGVQTVFTEDGNTDNITDFDIVVYTESVQTVEINQNGDAYTASQWRDVWQAFLNMS